MSSPGGQIWIGEKEGSEGRGGRVGTRELLMVTDEGEKKENRK